MYLSVEKAQIELALSDQEKLELQKRNLYLENQQALKMEEMYVCNLMLDLHLAWLYRLFYETLTSCLWAHV